MPRLTTKHGRGFPSLKGFFDRLVVRNTFIDVCDKSPERNRASTDSAIVCKELLAVVMQRGRCCTEDDNSELESTVDSLAEPALDGVKSAEFENNSAEVQMANDAAKSTESQCALPVAEEMPAVNSTGPTMFFWHQGFPVVMMNTPIMQQAQVVAAPEPPEPVPQEKPRLIAPAPEKKKSRALPAHRTLLRSGEQVTPESVGTRTTVMLRNLPNNYTAALVLEMLDKEGFAGLYDFFYLPIDMKSHACLGYAFINLAHPSHVHSFWTVFNGYSNWVIPSRKLCSVTWSGDQGFDAFVQRYRDSPLMHRSVPSEYKPMIFKDGVRVPFLPSTKPLRAPRLRGNDAQ